MTAQHTRITVLGRVPRPKEVGAGLLIQSNGLAVLGGLALAADLIERCLCHDKCRTAADRALPRGPHHTGVDRRVPNRPVRGRPVRAEIIGGLDLVPGTPVPRSGRRLSAGGVAARRRPARHPGRRPHRALQGRGSDGRHTREVSRRAAVSEWLPAPAAVRHRRGTGQPRHGRGGSQPHLRDGGDRLRRRSRRSDEPGRDRRSAGPADRRLPGGVRPPCRRVPVQGGRPRVRRRLPDRSRCAATPSPAASTWAG